MQAQAMLASQLSAAQSRTAFRAPQIGSCSVIRGASPVLVASRPVARTQVAMATVAVAAVEQADAVAHLRFSRGSPTKVRRVLDQIRGRSYEEALMILEYMPYKACEPVIKTLLSAASNAKQKGIQKRSLVVSECYANEGPILKRAMPRAQGRANPIHKPMVHITIKVAEK